MGQVLQTSCARLAVLVVVGVAALTACSGSLVRSPTAPVTSDLSSKEGAGAPMPQDAPSAPPLVKRDVVKTAAMTISAAHPAEAADKAAVVAANADGRVDNRSEDAGSGTGRARATMVLRVPAAKLDAVLGELKTLGTVEHVEITSDDVTAQRVDLDARIKALQTSVDRLLGIMRDARDPDSLIKAEGALSERQAELDSLRAQREALGDQIDYSTVNVTFVAQTIGGPAPTEYRGFFGQIERGWDGLVSVVGNLVLLVGLLLPWLMVLAVAGAIVYGVVRLARARRREPPSPPTTAVDEPAEDEVSPS